MIEPEVIYGTTIKIPQLQPNENILNEGKERREQKWLWEDLPDYFEKVTYNKSGDLILTSEQEEYASIEVDRCKKGIHIWINNKIKWLPPKYYFYLKFWVLEDGNRPEYRDCDRRYFTFLWHWERIQWAIGTIRGKRRREGASSQATSNLVYECIFVLNSNCGLISKTRDDARATFTDMVAYGYRQLPPFLKPKQINSEDSVTEFIFEQRVEVGDKKEIRRSKINYRAPVINAYDSGRMSRILIDEGGKLPPDVPANQMLAIVSKTLVKGVKRVGFIEMPSTVNKLTKGGAGFKLIWESADLNKKTPTVNRLVRYFCPAHDGYEGFIDEFGDSVVDTPNDEQREYLVNKWVKKDDDGNVISELSEEDIKLGSKAYIAKRRIGMTGDDLEEEIRMNPENEVELFMSANADCIFNVMNLNEQIEYLKENPVYKRKILYYRDLETGKVKWRDIQPNEDSFCWEWVGDLDLKGHDNKHHTDGMLKRPSRTDIGVIGVDSYSNTQGGKKYGSKASAWVYIKYDLKDPENTGLFTGHLYGRPTDKETLHDQVMLCAEYNGFQIYYEFVSDDYYTHFKNRGRLGYLAKFPLNAIAPERKKGDKVERHYGFPITDFAMTKQNDAMITYVLYYYRKIYWIELCEDLKMYDPKARTPSDRTVSAMIALVGGLEPIRKPPPQKTALIEVYHNS